MIRVRRTALLIIAVLAVTAPARAATPPAPAAAAYILVNPDTGEVLAARNPDKRLPMASTTKMMTALVAVERSRLSDRVVVPGAAASVGESSADLVPGERIAMRDLLTGLLVGSGNDAAIAVADAVGGSVPRFAAMMNRRAKQLGATRTHYVNPHGLDAPGHHSTVRDLVTVGEALMADPRLRPIVAQRRATIPGPGGVGVRRLESENDLLDIDRDADGVKTGHTDGAGYALVAHAARPRLGVQLYGAVIGAPSQLQRATDMRRLLDWGFAQYARPVVVRDRAPLLRLPVRDVAGQTLLLRASGGDLSVPVRIGRPIRASIEAPGEAVAPVAKGQVLGRVVMRQDGRVLGVRQLVADRDVPTPGVVDRLRSALESLVP